MIRVRPKTLLQKYTGPLREHYGEGEAEAICRLLLQESLQIDRAKLMINDEMDVDDDQVLFFDKAIDRLLKDEPVQHILGFAYFYDRPFSVNEHVLIPRQETEELVSLIIDQYPGGKIDLLDIGTGTGCIPITLALALPQVKATGLDVSEEALHIAQQNANKLNAVVEFVRKDILQDDIQGRYDVIVSNPPYITQAERTTMHANVLDYEPGLALFVPNNDPLRFYRRITALAIDHLKPGGRLYFEINEHYGSETKDLLDESGFSETRLISDLNGKHRIVTGYIQPTSSDSIL